VNLVLLNYHVDLSGKKLAHNAPHGPRARDFVNFRKKFHASRARGAPYRMRVGQFTFQSPPRRDETIS
jgi:hypothetical protein